MFTTDLLPTIKQHLQMCFRGSKIVWDAKRLLNKQNGKFYCAIRWKFCELRWLFKKQRREESPTERWTKTALARFPSKKLDGDIQDHEGPEELSPWFGGRKWRGSGRHFRGASRCSVTLELGLRGAATMRLEMREGSLWLGSGQLAKQGEFSAFLYAITVSNIHSYNCTSTRLWSFAYFSFLLWCETL